MTKPGRLALVGSGEFVGSMLDVQSWLAEGRPPTMAHVSVRRSADTASATRSRELGAEAAARLGASYVVVDVSARTDAADERLAGLVAGAGLIHISAEDGVHAAAMLRGSALWNAIRTAWTSGSSLAGSAGAASALCGYLPDARHPTRGGADGLGLLPDLRVLTRFDTLSRLIPDSALRALVMPGTTVIGIDEETALIAERPGEPGPWTFRSRGRSSCWRIEDDRRHRVNGPMPLRVAA